MAKDIKKKPPYNKEAAIRGALRRTFSRSPIVREVLDESRQEFPRYKKDGTRHKKNWVKRQCQTCNKWVPSSQIAVDHVIPVISVEYGKQDWNEFIERLWCEKSNLRRICSVCHDTKSYKERIERLLIKYNRELDEIETLLKSFNGPYKVSDSVFAAIIKENKKLLSKYIAKKKTPDLMPVVERALSIRENLLKGKYNV